MNGRKFDPYLISVIELTNFVNFVCIIEPSEALQIFMKLKFKLMWYLE